MENEPSQVNAVEAAKRINDPQLDNGEVNADALAAPETEREALVEEFVEDAGEKAVENTVAGSPIETMSPADIEANIDTLLASGTDPSDIFDKLGPKLYYGGNVTKLLDAGLSARKALDFFSEGGNNVTGSAVIAQNLEAFIKSGIGANSIAEKLEPGWLSQSFDKLIAAGMTLPMVDGLVADGKLKTSDVEQRRQERATTPQIDAQYGVDSVIDLKTGKTVDATRAPQDSSENRQAA
jgi:hypothetical protein